MERTVILFKPDAMQQGCAGIVLQRFLDAHFSIVAVKMMQLDEAILRQHYSHLVDKVFFKDIVEFMTSTPVIAMILEGNDVVAKVREMTGPTDSMLAPKGTIRGDFGKNKTQNILHASDSVESAHVEIERFFKSSEIF
jgi:nucleoside-diphosphate kinase